MVLKLFLIKAKNKGVKMKLYDSGFLMIIVVLTGIAVLTAGANRLFDLDGDHPIEELVEDVIEDQTGLDIDLSPNSPENRS